MDHLCYAEVFMGMGGVFLKRHRAPKCEVINDISQDVTNLFRILQRHYEAFMGELKYRHTSRADFARLNATAPDQLTDLERAARFLYLQKTGFGGKVTGRVYGTLTTSGARFDVNKLGPILDAIHERMGGVQIECLDYAKFISVYDRPHTLFYIDPPHYNHEDDYGKGVFNRENFGQLAEQLATIKGDFIMSINDLFKGRAKGLCLHDLRLRCGDRHEN
ncbi:MAG: DNA adenine methylase, partial [Pseudomonadota bacterium]